MDSSHKKKKKKSSENLEIGKGFKIQVYKVWTENIKFLELHLEAWSFRIWIWIPSSKFFKIRFKVYVMFTKFFPLNYHDFSKIGLIFEKSTTFKNVF